jgi:hypothetical protein
MMRLAPAQFIGEYEGGFPKRTNVAGPYLHAGLGVRALRRGVYECRATQSVRIGFTRHGDTLLVRTVGSHGTIRTWLKNNL